MTSLRIGKQIVYHALQDSSQGATTEAIAALIQDIEMVQDQLSTVKAEEKRARASLAVLEAKPRLSDLERDIQQLDSEREAIRARLGNFQEGNEVQISVEDRGKLEEEWKQWQRHATVRRRICRDLWSQCTEVLPENTTSQELWVRYRWSQKRIGAANRIVRSLWGLKGRSNER